MRNRRSRGQASVSLIATIPLLLLLALAVAQLAAAGFGAWSAANAARAAARASYAGLDPGAAARAALPSLLADGADVETDAERAEVEVRVPRLVPAIGSIEVSSSAHLAPANGSADGS
jgi:hypothetical protein